MRGPDCAVAEMATGFLYRQRAFSFLQRQHILAFCRFVGMFLPAARCWNCWGSSKGELRALQSWSPF